MSVVVKNIHFGTTSQSRKQEAGLKRTEKVRGRREGRVKCGGGGSSGKSKKGVRWRRRGPDGDREGGRAERQCLAGLSRKETKSMAESRMETDTN